LASRIHQLQIDAFEAGAAALDQRALDIAAADQPDFDIGRHAGTRNHDLKRLLGDKHRVVEAAYVETNGDRLIGSKATDKSGAARIRRLFSLLRSGRDDCILLHRLAGIANAVVVEVAVDKGAHFAGLRNLPPREREAV